MANACARMGLVGVAKTSLVPASSGLARQASTSEASLDQSSVNPASQRPDTAKSEAEGPKKTQQKTIAQLDEELRLKMQGISGDGGEAGVEYENGEPVAMKRSVKENMFRLI